MYKKDQRGVAHLAVIVAVVAILAAVGVVVFQAIQKRSNKDTTADTQNQTSNTTTTKTTSDEEKAVEAAKKHFQLVKDNKVSDAYNVTCNKFKTYTSLADFEDLVKTSSIFDMDLVNFNYTNKSVANGQARLSGDVGPLAPDKALEVDLLQENSDWCVYGYRVN